MPLTLEGAIFGENRGRRTLHQLQRRGQLSVWLTVEFDRARALADEAWGRAPGIPRDQKLRLAYLAAVCVVDRYGLDARLLTVTRAVRYVLRAARLGAPGLAGGESATWIRDMVKGELASFERELAEAANRLERNEKN